jgi:hypothetical protein
MNDLERELCRAIGVAGREVQLETDATRQYYEGVLRRYGRRMTAAQRQLLEERIEKLRRAVSVPNELQLTYLELLARDATHGATTANTNSGAGTVAPKVDRSKEIAEK